MYSCVGIVAEYNPFHNGHKYQTDYIKRKGCDSIIACMSGACVQRGQFAMLSKYDRADMALSGGVDAVIELPVPFSIKSAEGFAKNGMLSLKNAGADAISFGCECDDVSLLSAVADYLLTNEFEVSLKQYIASGKPFAEAREKALFDGIPQSAGILAQSNNILAVEYLKACKSIKWNPGIIAVKRNGESYNSKVINDKNPSATGVRNAVDEFRFENAVNTIPPLSQELFTECLDRGRYFSEKDASFEKMLLYKLRTSDINDFAKIDDCNEELSHSIEKAVLRAENLSQLYDSMPTKRYTRARINRILLSLVLGIDNTMPKEIQYLRILGVKKDKENLIKQIASASELPVSHSAKILREKNELCRKIADAESVACDIQSTFFKISGEARTDYTTKLIKK